MAQATDSSLSPPRALSTKWLLVLQLLAFWPVGLWYIQRITDRSDEPWGIVALVTVIVYVWTARKQASVLGPAASLSIAALLLVYMISLFCAPDLVQALIAVTCLAITACAMVPRGCHLAVVSLSILSLPLIPSLQFFCGYPLRVLVVASVVPLVQAAGLPVTVDGTGLNWGGQYIGVDPACSGVRMLWTSCYLGAALACFNNLSAKKALTLIASSLGAAIVGNIARAFLLLMLEVGRRHLHSAQIPSWLHEAIGGSVFVLVCVSIAALSWFLGQGKTMPALPKVVFRLEPWARPQNAFCLILLLLSALLPLISTGGQAVCLNTKTKASWPQTFEGQALSPLPLSDEETRFAQGFPGNIAKFSCGGKTLIFRWLTRETRQLHPSSDCFKGNGYKVSALPTYLDAAGNRWGCFQAQRGGQKLMVTERITDDRDGNWTDVSHWYWAALMKQTRGPWLSITAVAPDAR